MTNELKNDSTQPNVPKKETRAKRREQKDYEQPRRWVQIRIIPIWLRIVLVLILFFIAAMAGLMIGFGIIGGGEPLDALKWETYQHILDILGGKE